MIHRIHFVFRLGLRHWHRVPDSQLEAVYICLPVPRFGCSHRRRLHAGEPTFPAGGQTAANTHSVVTVY